MRDKYVYLFEVIHHHIIEMDHQNQPICDSKFIGLYSHKKQAESAVERFKTLPGFVLYPSGFFINRKVCYISDECVQKMPGTKVYMPYHEYYIPEEDCDYCTRGNYFTAGKKPRRCWINGRTIRYFHYIRKAFLFVNILLILTVLSGTKDLIRL